MERSPEPALELRLSLVDARRVVLALVLVEVGFVSVHLVDALLGPLGKLRALFALDEEATLPTWFSSVLLFTVAGIFLVASLRTAPGARRPSPPLLLLSALFAFLSLDEAIAIHERITEAFVGVAFLPRFRGEHGIWIPFYLAAAVSFVLILRRWIRAMWRNRRRDIGLLVLGAAVFVLGAVVLEVISYQLLERDGSTLYLLEVAAEEFLEMLGATLILYAGIRISSRTAELEVQEVLTLAPDSPELSLLSGRQ